MSLGNCREKSMCISGMIMWISLLLFRRKSLALFYTLRELTLVGGLDGAVSAVCASLGIEPGPSPKSPTVAITNSYNCKNKNNRDYLTFGSGFWNRATGFQPNLKGLQIRDGGSGLRCIHFPLLHTVGIGVPAQIYFKNAPKFHELKEMTKE